MKKVLSIVIAAILILGVSAGCSGNSNTPAENQQETSAGAPEAAASDKMLKIGVVQLVEHPALDASYQGFVDGLAKAGYEDGKNITIDYQNAQGEQANCNTIASKLVNDKNDLILAIATPAAQAVANATTEIPIVITAVTDPEDAKLVDSNEAPGRNVTGTSDRTPCAEQIELLTKLMPEAKTVGMLYCSSESNSKLQVDLAKAAAEKLGLSTAEYTVSNSNEIQQVVESMMGKVDAIYVPTDNMIAAGMTTVSMIATENKIPIIGAESNQVDNGALATYGLSYYDLGVLTAEQAVKILEGAKPAEMPIAYLSKFELSVNDKIAEALGITIPEGL